VRVNLITAGSRAEGNVIFVFGETGCETTGVDIALILF
jgi:hypothetical protein